MRGFKAVAPPPARCLFRKRHATVFRRMQPHSALPCRRASQVRQSHHQLPSIPCSYSACAEFQRDHLCQRAPPSACERSNMFRRMPKSFCIQLTVARLAAIPPAVQFSAYLRYSRTPCRRIHRRGCDISPQEALAFVRARPGVTNLVRQRPFVHHRYFAGPSDRLHDRGGR